MPEDIPLHKRASILKHISAASCTEALASFIHLCDSQSEMYNNLLLGWSYTINCCNQTGDGWKELMENLEIKLIIFSMIHGTYIWFQCGISACVHLCGHMCAMGTCICAHTHVDARSWCQVSFLVSLYYLPRQGLLKNPKILDVAHLAGQLAPGMPSVCFSSVGLLVHHTCTIFLQNLGSELQTSCLCRKHFFYPIVPALTLNLSVNIHCMCLTSQTLLLILRMRTWTLTSSLPPGTSVLNRLN